MYRIKKEGYGFRLTFGGSIPADEMAQWLSDFRTVVDSVDGPFSVLVDMRTLIPLTHEAQEHVHVGQRYAADNGMERSIVVLRSPVTTAQFKRIAGETGIFRNERYLDASSEADWEQVALDWVEKALDPDKRPAVVR